MKKKKKKKGFIILLIVFLIILGAGGVVYKNMTPVSAENTQEIVAGENQTILTVSIQNMIGNEMTGTIDGSEETQTTWMIPVGTDVVTKLGTTTTFARLSSGNQIEMLVDDATQEILKIWIQQ